MTSSVLIVDDEASVRAALVQTMELDRLKAAEAADLKSALRMVEQAMPHVIVSDITMPSGDGFALLQAMQELDADLPVILLTGNGDVPMAVRGMSEGAYDFLEKPISPASLLEVTHRAIEKRKLILENRLLKREVAAARGKDVPMVFGQSASSVQFQDRLLAIADAEVDVLIEGDTGTGKEVAARAIHHLSDRRSGPFIVVNCGALPADLAVAELFGYDAGAVPGTPPRAGQFEAAHQGIILLDEIDAMPPDIQLRILRVLQDREVRRVGSTHTASLDIRIIATSKNGLKTAVDKGQFRDDLYYHLEGARLILPPLRDRITDAPELFSAFLAQSAAKQGRECPPMTVDMSNRLLRYDWPGNIRELKNVAERFVQGLGLEIGGDVIAIMTADDYTGTLSERMELFERKTLSEALTAAGGRVTIAAQTLGLPRKTLYDKLARHGLRSADFRP